MVTGDTPAKVVDARQACRNHRSLWEVFGSRSTKGTWMQARMDRWLGRGFGLAVLLGAPLTFGFTATQAFAQGYGQNSSAGPGLSQYGATISPQPTPHSSRDLMTLSKRRRRKSSPQSNSISRNTMSSERLYPRPPLPRREHSARTFLLRHAMRSRNTLDPTALGRRIWTMTVHSRVYFSRGLSCWARGRLQRSRISSPSSSS